jgi:hypothetical protein
VKSDALTIWAAHSHLPPGDHYVVCPVCNGGSTNSTCLWIRFSDSGGFVWYCHRAHCDVSGSHGIAHNDGAYNDPLADTGECVRIPSLPLTEAHRDVLWKRWRVSTSLAATLRTYDRGRVLFPIRDLLGIERGCVLRDVTGRARLKALTRKPATYSLGSWHRRFADSSVWIVEDAVSALRASQYVNVVALLGTHVPPALMKELRRWKRVNVALDADAFARSCAVADSLAVWTDARPVPITKDFKDMECKQLEDVVCQ